MKVIVTGATGMVGEGVLMTCLDSPEVERVLSVSRRPSGRTHPKLSERGFVPLPSAGAGAGRA